MEKIWLSVITVFIFTLRRGPNQVCGTPESNVQFNYTGGIHMPADWRKLVYYSPNSRQ
jgi:hypothetical protein